MLKRILGLLGWLGVALVFAAVAIRVPQAGMAAVRQRPGDRAAWSARCSTSSASGARSARRSRDGRRGSARWRPPACWSCSAILVAINYLGTRHNKRWDLTAAKQFSLSDQTKKVLQDLKEPVKRARLRAQRASSSASAIGSTSTRTSRSRLDGEYIDPEKKPARRAAVRRHGAQHGRVRLQGTQREGHVRRRAGADQRADQGDPGPAAEGVLHAGPRREGHGQRRSHAATTAIADGADRPTTSSSTSSCSRSRATCPADADVADRRRTEDRLPAARRSTRSRRISRKGGKLLVMLDPVLKADQPQPRWTAGAARRTGASTPATTSSSTSAAWAGCFGDRRIGAGRGAATRRIRSPRTSRC